MRDRGYCINRDLEMTVSLRSILIVGYGRLIVED